MARGAARGTGECGSGQGDRRGQGERGRPWVGRGQSGGRPGAARGKGGESAKGTGSGQPGGEAGDGRRFRDHRGKLFPPHRSASGGILEHFYCVGNTFGQ